MEAIGFVASVGQISAYAFSILETMQKIRALARDGPDQLQEKVQQLDILLTVVCRIEGNQNLRDDAIARYLASIQKKIRRLLEAVHVNLSKLGARTFKGLLAAIRIISTEKLFDASFTAISQDCNTLALHIMSSPNEDVSTRSLGRIHALYSESSRLIAAIEEEDGSKTFSGIQKSQWTRPAASASRARRKEQPAHDAAASRSTRSSNSPPGQVLSSQRR
jgi:hypothetical protein